MGGSYVTDNDTSFDPTTYDDDFTYTPTANEEADWTDGLTWDSDDLLWGLPSEVIKRVTDTTVTVEDANITGQDVTLIVGGKLGQEDDTSLFISVPDGDLANITDDDDNTIRARLLAAEAEDVQFYVWTDTNNNDEADDGELVLWTTGDVIGSENDPIEYNEDDTVTGTAPGGVHLVGIPQSAGVFFLGALFGTDTYSLDIADVNKDGPGDVIADGVVYLNDGTGLAYTELSETGQAGDLTGDEIPDLLTYDYAQYEHTLTITVKENDGAAVPSFTTTTQSFSLAGFLLEDETGYIHSVRIGDVTGDGETFSFSIIRGKSDADDYFTMDASTGEITLLQDAPTAGDYELWVKVSSDFTLDDDYAWITISVTDAPDAPTLTARVEENTLGENPVDGTVLDGISFDVSDPDAGETFTYSISSDGFAGGDPYAIDPDTGELSVADGSLLDYEDPEARSITLTVRATDSDGLYDETDVTVDLIDFVSAPEYSATCRLWIEEGAETGTAITSWLASDADVGNGDRLRYYFLLDGDIESASTADGAIGIDPDTGELSVLDGSLIDHTTADTFTDPVDGKLRYGRLVNAYVVDTEGEVGGPQQIGLRILFEGETPDLVDGQSFTIPEDAGAGDIVGTVQVNSVNDDQAFSIIAGDDENDFVIDPTSGQITVSGDNVLNYSVYPTYALTVQLADGSDIDTTTVTSTC